MPITKFANDLLKPHQSRAIDRLSDDEIRGLLAYHSMGAGKTLTALKAAEKALSQHPQGKALFITPASLQDNIYKERDKHKIALPDDRILVRSYEKAVRDADQLAEESFPFVAVDEAHKMRNAETQRSKLLRDIIAKADKRLLLTGTAGYNHPADILHLLRLIDPELKVPQTNTEFEQLYIDKNTGKLTDKGRKALKTWQKLVDVYDVADDPDVQREFPKSEAKTVQVPMSPEQQKVYKYLENKLPPHLRRSVRKNMPLSLRESANLNAFSSGIRQASTGHFPYDPKALPEDSGKIREAVKAMAEAAQQSPGFRGVAYSNYLKAGVSPYAELLREEGIDPLVLTGSLSRKQKAELVKRYNEKTDDPRVFVLSSSGGEGLDLQGTRKLQILEPHFNQAKIDQIKARASRYKSHNHLPEDQRKVDIEEYQSTFQPAWYHKLFKRTPPTTIDSYLSDLSKRKQTTIDEIKQELGITKQGSMLLST